MWFPKFKLKCKRVLIPWGHACLALGLGLIMALLVPTVAVIVILAAALIYIGLVYGREV